MVFLSKLENVFDNKPSSWNIITIWKIKLQAYKYLKK